MAAKFVLFRLHADAHPITPVEYFHEMEGLRFLRSEDKSALKALLDTGYVAENEVRYLVMSPKHRIMTA